MEMVTESHELNVVGIGPGSSEYILPAARRLIIAADVLAGGKRALADYADAAQKKIVIDGNIERALQDLERALQTYDVTVMVSGDPGYYSLLTALKERFPDKITSVIPGVSSLQMAFARLQLPWQQAKWISFHGRTPQQTEYAYEQEKIIGILTDSVNNPHNIAALLLDNGWPEQTKIYIAQNLSYPNEKIVNTDLATLSRESTETYPNSCLIALAVPAVSARTATESDNYLGIDDAEFYRANVPMTKQEVRIITVAKARIAPAATVYDIGAGTGSLSVEAARQAAQGQVYAWEKNGAAAELIRTNMIKFGTKNITIIDRAAPQGMEDTPPADVIIIGGSGGNLTEILAAADRKLKNGGRMVLNFIALQNLTLTLDYLHEKKNYAYEVCQMQFSRLRRVGSYDMAEALNPVYIVTCEKKGEI